MIDSLSKVSLMLAVSWCLIGFAAGWSFYFPSHPFASSRWDGWSKGQQALALFMWGPICWVLATLATLFLGACYGFDWVWRNAWSFAGKIGPRQ